MDGVVDPCGTSKVSIFLDSQVGLVLWTAEISKGAHTLDYDRSVDSDTSWGQC